MAKVFAFDIDGTFINDQHKVQQSHINALIKAKKKGHHLVLCSGRPYFDMIPVLRQVPSGLFRYLICNNGAYVVDLETSKRIMPNDVPFSILEDFEKVGRENEFAFAIHTLASINRGVFWDINKGMPQWFGEMNEDLEEKAKSFISWEEAKEIAKNQRISQLSFLGPKEIIEKSINKINEHKYKVNIHIAGQVYLDINPEDVSKLTGIEILSKEINLTPKDFVVFGDSGNDIQMLKGAGLGIAMGNATDEAKKYADEIIGNNNTSAIADKVLELI